MGSYRKKRKNRKFTIENFVTFRLTHKDEVWIIQHSLILRGQNVANHHFEAIRAYFKKIWYPLYLVNKKSKWKKAGVSRKLKSYTVPDALTLR